jgi:hypothetical protein
VDGQETPAAVFDWAASEYYNWRKILAGREIESLLDGLSVMVQEN